MGRQSRAKPKTTGAKLKMIRQHCGLTQTAMLAVVRPGHDPENRAVISQYEKGITDPDYPTLLRYARHARLSTDVLINDECELTAAMLRRTDQPTAPLSGELPLTPPVADYDHAADQPEKGNAATAAAVISRSEADNGAGGDASVAAENLVPPPKQNGADDSARAAPAAEGKSAEAKSIEGKSAEVPRRRLSDKMLAALDHDLEHFSTYLPRRLLDELDDLYLAHLRTVPRRSRLLLDRRYFYHSLFTAFLIRAGERPLDCLSPVWEEVVRQVEDNADQPPDLFSTEHLN